MSEKINVRSDDVIEAAICGIPCLIRIDDCLDVPPWKGPAHTAPSDLDYYGYTECDYTVFDRKGYRAKWLERKITKKDDDKICRLIIDCN